MGGFPAISNIKWMVHILPNPFSVTSNDYNLFAQLVMFRVDQVACVSLPIAVDFGITAR